MGSYTSHPSVKKGLRSQVTVKLESLFWLISRRIQKAEIL